VTTRPDEPRESDDSIDARWERSLVAVGGFHSGINNPSQIHDEEFAAAGEQ